MNDLYPEVMEQIYHDLYTGFHVLGIPERKFKIKLYDHESHIKQDNRYGYVIDDDDWLEFYLADKMIETERDKANLSFVVWSTLRWWYRRECLRHWNSTHELYGNIIETDIGIFKAFIPSMVWITRKDFDFSQKFYDQLAFHDMHAFALMMLRHYWPEYCSEYWADNATVQSRVDELAERYSKAF